MMLDAHDILDEEDFDISLSTVASNPPQPLAEVNLDEESLAEVNVDEKDSSEEDVSEEDVSEGDMGEEDDLDGTPPNPIPPVESEDLLFIDESHIEISFDDDDDDDFDESNSPSAVLSGPPQEIEAIISGAPQEIKAENTTRNPTEIKLDED
jgi:hypothetical protein